MAKWKCRIKLPGFSDADPEDFPKYAAMLARDLRRQTGRWMDDDLANLIEEFHDLDNSNGETPGATVDDFDAALEELYDWGDRGHRLWIDGFANASLAV